MPASPPRPNDNLSCVDRLARITYDCPSAWRETPPLHPRRGKRREWESMGRRQEGLHGCARVFTVMTPLSCWLCATYIGSQYMRTCSYFTLRLLSPPASRFAGDSPKTGAGRCSGNASRESNVLYTPVCYVYRDTTCISLIHAEPTLLLLLLAFFESGIPLNNCCPTSIKLRAGSATAQGKRHMIQDTYLALCTCRPSFSLHFSSLGPASWRSTIA